MFFSSFVERGPFLFNDIVTYDSSLSSMDFLLVCNRMLVMMKLMVLCVDPHLICWV